MRRNLYYCVSLLLLFTLSCSDQGKIIITKVYEGENGRAVFYDTDKEKGNLFISHNLYLYTILDKTEDNTWIIVEQEPVIAEEGRVETELQLYNIPEAKQIFLEDIDPSWSLYGSYFVKKAGIDYLAIAIGVGVEEVSVPLDELLEKAKSAKHEYIEPAPAEEAEQETGPEVVSEIETGEVVMLELGTEEGQIGQDMADKQLEGGKSIYSEVSVTPKNQKMDL
jgi:hypothetical protein